jgi:hypothetical protein
VGTAPAKGVMPIEPVSIFLYVRRCGGPCRWRGGRVAGSLAELPWLGDQLTVGRLRRLWKYRHEDYNSYDRMDWMIPVFGWFHLIMALANSLHKQYPSTSANIGGLRQAFDVLNRKGLISQATKGPFWHKAIKHISEAHFWACWLVVGNVKSLAELKALSPTQLRVMARNILFSASMLLVRPWLNLISFLMMNKII